MPPSCPCPPSSPPSPLPFSLARSAHPPLRSPASSLPSLLTRPRAQPRVRTIALASRVSPPAGVRGGGGCVRMCVRALVHVPFVHLFLFPFPLFLPYFLFPPFRLSPPVPSGFTCKPRIRKSGEIPPLQVFSKLRLKPQIGVRSRKQGKPIVAVQKNN